MVDLKKWKTWITLASNTVDGVGQKFIKYIGSGVHNSNTKANCNWTKILDHSKHSCAKKNSQTFKDWYMQVFIPVIP